MSAPSPHTVTQLDAHVIAAAFDKAGNAAFALGDGTLHLAPAAGGPWSCVRLCAGSVLALEAAPGDSGLLCGTDDGRFDHVAADGSLRHLGYWPGKWVEHVASGGGGRDGVLACSVGRRLHVLDAHGTVLNTLDHPSSVTGIAFDAKAKRIAASHYNGASLWFARSKSATPRRLEWKGSHIGVAFHPAGDAVVTAMQESALHGWRLADGQHMRMSGYPAKTQSLAFTASGRWLTSSGADAVVCWPFFGGGPMGKAPLELGGGNQVLCTRVACHPRQDLCAAGFADGSLVLANLAARTVLPLPAAPAAVSALAWSPDGSRIAWGSEQGSAGIMTLE